MVLFDVAFSFVAAGTMGWRAKGSRPDLPLVFTGCGLAPVGLIFLERYPAWDWQYLVDPATVPDTAPAVFVGAIGVAAVAGHKVGSRSIKPVAVAAGLWAPTQNSTLEVGFRFQWSSLFLRFHG